MAHIECLINVSSRSLPSVYYVPGTVVGIWDAAENETYIVPVLLGLMSGGDKFY